MGFELTGQKVSFTYDRLVQYIDGSFYNGLGVPINIADTSSLNVILVNYIPDASLNATQFFWNTGILDVSITGGVSQVYVDASFINIRAIYIPDVSLNISYFKWVGGLLEPSIASGTSDVTKAYVDGSLGEFIRSTSLGTTLYWDGDVFDVSAIGDVTKAYVDGSLGSFVRNASLGTDFYWLNGILYADVSVIAGGVIKTYVDGSLATRDELMLAYAIAL